jgi:glycosyltransferase involved in cell wall biosynthesis
MSATLAPGTSRPLVSVILPTRDRLPLLRRAVTSVRAQSERRFELLVVDDGSTDGTRAYLERLAAEDQRVRVVRNALPLGGSGARNEGVRLSRGAWVAFIDDDDEWLPRKLERQLVTLAAHPTAVACSCSYIVRSPVGRERVLRVPSDVTLQQLLKRNFLGGASGCVCASETLRRIGGFDTRLRSAQDLDLWVRLRQQGEVAVCTQPLLVHHVHAGLRITTDTQSQYLGVRRFHLKHRALMCGATRAHWVAYSCYVMSTQATRRQRRRWRLLALAILNSSPRDALAFLRRSAPLLVRDTLLRGRANTDRCQGASS